ncbi:hypothetical protein BRC64_01320 [Halobacteriales archaeon QH_10_67_22]|jgi:hypothetical protein|nr:MAG: hypothetical protein BRC64_01320 [Halobacteriales archaeon QH_10_67_22]
MATIEYESAQPDREVECEELPDEALEYTKDQWKIDRGDGVYTYIPRERVYSVTKSEQTASHTF